MLERNPYFEDNLFQKFLYNRGLKQNKKCIKIQFNEEITEKLAVDLN